MTVNTNQNKNKKGFAFTTDALAAAFLLSLLFAFILLHDSPADEFTPKLHLSRAGSDLVRLLENNGGLDQLNSGAITSSAANISTDLDLRLNITYSDTKLQQKSSLISGGSPGNEDFAAAGKRFFVTKNSTDITNFAVARYWVWRK